MVPGRGAQSCLEPVALPLPAGCVPLPGPDRCQRRPRPGPVRVRAAGHRRVRRRPVLDHRGVLRQGRPDDLLMAIQVTNAAPRPGRCTCCPLPGSATPGPGTPPSPGWRCGPRATGRSPSRPPVPRPPGAHRRRRTRIPAAAAVLRERDQPGPAVRRCPGHALPEGRHQRPCCSGADTVNPDRTGTKCAFWYQLAVLPGQTAELRLRLRPAPSGQASSAGASSAAGASAALGAGFDRGYGHEASRGRRVLRRADPGRRQRGGGDGAAAGVRRPAGASSCTTTPSTGGWTAIRPSPNRRPSARTL